ncbi:MAG: 23S rRNA (adenine(2503)-C(2))-methyltransferase RlmN [Phycisphaerae bacterium]|nr:23S rRNA (adenine(2503)-C(2))-methyltransferase RlmN [Phycisphaerae bacterium]
MEPHEKIPVLELTVAELQAALAEREQAGYRAAQVADWVFKKSQTDPAKMTNLPPALRDMLTVTACTVERRIDSEDGVTKLLLSLGDGQHVECVLIPTADRATACLSTQVGCGMRCVFCASGLGGLKRNLTGGEILAQILLLQQACERRVTNVVFMGIGEPLANYDATLAAVRAIIDPERLGISARNVTISTVGIPRAIRRLANEDLPVTLAISLHAPNDVLRRQLMPAAERFTIAEILDAARTFYEARHREITLEYLLIGGVNDTPVCADALVGLAHQLRCNVNLIRYNPVEGLPYTKPNQLAVQNFAQRLKKRGVNATIRRSRGADAAAACGQLRHTAEESQ